MSLLLRTVFAVTAGFLLDLMLGDPGFLYHPVRLIGHLITWTEKIIRGCFPKTKAGERAGGGVLVLFVIAVSMAVPGALLFLSYGYAWQAGLALETFMCYQIFAVKSLKTESDKVYQALKTEGPAAARKAVSMIVGRDTRSLTEEGVIKAAVETVAENTSDGVTAPLFYMVIGGAVLGFGYKAVNTMDSMLGYKNEKYKYFGTAAARLDDAANYIPARLTAWIMIGASFLAGMDWKNAVHIYLRDKRKHKSPNAAQTEAVMAGALGVELAGNAWYFGKLYEKPVIGDPLRQIEPEDIRRAHKLLYITAVLAMLLFLAVRIFAGAILAEII
ncbi:MAG: adenosylcobinamide-phosphate synthase CbiB [Lachnospiraceae bacterium]